MTLPLEQRLLESLRLAIGEDARAEVLTELAFYWARAGDSGRAENARIELRSKFADYRNPRIAVKIMVLEALQAYYGDVKAVARDRMFRASLLSKGLRDFDLIALTSAWMAHIDFNDSRFDSMIAEVNRSLNALGHMTSDPGFIPCRLALTLADTNLFAGHPVTAQSWYEVARREASGRGDHASIGALTYNRAALRVARARFDSIAGINSGIDHTLLRLDVESAINYQNAAQLTSLDYLLVAAKASLKVLQEDYEEAVLLLESLLADSIAPTPSPERLLSLADLALSYAKCGRKERAIGLVRECVRLYPQVTVVLADDQCLIAKSISLAAEICGLQEIADEWACQLSGALEVHGELCTRLTEQLAQFSPALLLSARSPQRS